MLPKEHRLTHTREFTRVRRFGRSSGGPVLALYVLPTRSRAIKAGFSVSKRVGKATVRNRVKRLLREAVRHRLPEIKPGCDLVFIARPAASQATYDQMTEAVLAALRRTHALQPAGSTHDA